MPTSYFASLCCALALTWLGGCGQAAGSESAESETATTQTTGAESESEGTSTGTGTGGPSAECENPVPVLDPITGEPTGYETCDDGLVHRPAAVACALPPSLGVCDSGGGEACTEDSQCADAMNGYCVDGPSALDWCGCVYACESDSDCSSGEVCACDDITGDVPRCVPAACQVDDDCAEGICGLSKISDGCGGLTIALACMDAQSDCRGRSCDPVQECFGDEVNHIPSCRPMGDTWQCYDDSCDGNCG